MAEPSPIILKVPSRYAPKTEDANESSPAPSLEWLSGTWAVTHSTLSMWRSARNVRITYTPLPPKPDGRLRVDDLVEYESSKSGVLKTVAGVDTQSPLARGGEVTKEAEGQQEQEEEEVERGQGQGGAGSWDWRGKGLLFFVSSHWEVLAWGEELTEEGETERWAVTWFAPTLFTTEGLDVYCDRREGLSEGTYRRIEEALKNGGKEVSDLAQAMMPVDIQLPWVGK